MQASRSVRGTFARPLGLLLAAVLSLPSCFTYMLWDEKLNLGLPPTASIRDAALAASEPGRMQIPIAPASRAAWQAELTCVTASTQAIEIELQDQADADRVRQLAAAPKAVSWLDLHVALDGTVTARLGVGPHSCCCRTKAVDAVSTATALAPVVVHVYRDRRDDTPTVTRVLLTPFAVALDAALLPFSVFGYFTL